MTFSQEDLSKYYGMSTRTLRRHINKLKEQNKFISTSAGRYYNENDAILISQLLGFNLPIQNKKSTPANQIDLVDMINEVKQEKKGFKTKFK